MENPSYSSSDSSEDLSNSAYLIQTLSGLKISTDDIPKAPAPQQPQAGLAIDTREQLSLNALAEARFTDTGLVFDPNDKHVTKEIQRVRQLNANSNKLTPAESCLYLLTASEAEIKDRLIQFNLSSVQGLQDDLSYLSTVQFEPLNGFLQISDHWKHVLLRLQLFFANQVLMQILAEKDLTDEYKNELLLAASKHSLFAPFGVIRQTIYMTSTLFGTPYCTSAPAQLFLNALKESPKNEFTPLVSS